MAGSLLLEKAERRGLKILPVDSEHSALFYLIQGQKDLSEVIITASGGPFFEWDNQDLIKATPEDALKHPTWNMGRKITIDSASMANKGLEVIEAFYLFNLKPEQIKVVVHRESLVHSFIRTKDNALYAHISRPDMRLPIQNALLYPKQCPVESVYIEPWNLNMNFFKTRNDAFPMLPLAYEALKIGQDGCILYNRVNELAVDSFLNNQIGFTQISQWVNLCFEKWKSQPITSLEDILECQRKITDLALKVKPEKL